MWLGEVFRLRLSSHLALCLAVASLFTNQPPLPLCGQASLIHLLKPQVCWCCVTAKTRSATSCSHLPVTTSPPSALRTPSLHLNSWSSDDAHHNLNLRFASFFLLQSTQPQPRICSVAAYHGPPTLSTSRSTAASRDLASLLHTPSR